MYDIIGIDMPCMDFAINLDSMPKANSSKHFKDLSFQGGNKVSTGMVAAARLGAKCLMLGAVGDDIFGRFCCEDFERHGITSKVIARENETTALSFVLSDQETMGRSVVYHPGTCRRLTTAEIPLEDLKNTKYYYLAWADEVVLYAAKTAKESGAKIFVDADKPNPDIIENIPLFDIFVASEFVYNAMFENDNYEENCRNVQAMGPEIVVFTLGAKGCCGVTKDGKFFMVQGRKVKVADTVGAGDVFHGAFLACLIRGMDEEAAATFANAVSAIKCTRIGGRAGIPDFETTKHYIETGEIDYSEIDKRVKFYERFMN